MHLKLPFFAYVCFRLTPFGLYHWQTSCFCLIKRSISLIGNSCTVQLVLKICWAALQHLRIFWASSWGILCESLKGRQKRALWAGDVLGTLKLHSLQKWLISSKRMEEEEGLPKWREPWLFAMFQLTIARWSSPLDILATVFWRWLWVKKNLERWAS